MTADEIIISINDKDGRPLTHTCIQRMCPCTGPQESRAVSHTQEAVADNLFEYHHLFHTQKIANKKNAFALETPHVAVFTTVILVSRFFGNSIREIIDDLQETFH